VSPESFLGHFTVFALAWSSATTSSATCHHALHTPLMSVTNAISGIIVVGALLPDRPRRTRDHGRVAFIALLLASINVFGGFTVTQRMLAMFSEG
jgi:NAD(P) transhydrogenase subunit alpha